MSRVTRPWRRRASLALLALASIAIAGFDQIPTRGYRPDDEAARFYRDRSFFRRVERTLPRAAQVLVHPYAAFPEGATRGAFGPYDGLRLFVHSRALRVSAGAIAGRAGDVFLSGLVRESPARRVAEAVRAGFDAVLVGRVGLPRGDRRDAFLDALGAPLLSNEDWLLFRLPRSVEPSPPVIASALGHGFLGWERLGGRRHGTWAAGDAEILLAHVADQRVATTVAMRLVSLDARSVTFRVNGRTTHVAHLRANAPEQIAFQVAIPRGLTRIQVTTDRDAIDPGNGDLRDLAFGISDLTTVAR